MSGNNKAVGARVHVGKAKVKDKLLRELENIGAKRVRYIDIKSISWAIATGN